MKLSISRLRSHTTWIAFFAAAFVVPAAWPYLSAKAGIVNSGQRFFGESEVQPAFDDSTGNTIYRWRL